MMFKRSSMALFISTSIATSVSAASSIDLENRIKQFRQQNQQQNVAQLTNRPSIKNDSEANIASKIFNWKKANIRNIPINGVQPFKQQQKSTLSSYFKQVSGVKNRASFRSSDPIVAESIHDIGRGAIVAKYQQKIDGIEVFGSTVNIVMNRKNEFINSSGDLSQIKQSLESHN